MNHGFKTVWNDSLQAWVATSELSRAKGKRNERSATRSSDRVAKLLAVGAFALCGVASAVAGTCVQLDAQGTSSAGGTGASKAASCGAFSIAIGGGSGATASNIGVAIGDASYATGQDSVGIGRVVTATGNYSTAVGSRANSSGLYSTSIGQYSVASGDQTTALGRGASATGVGATAIGTNGTGASSAAGAYSLAIGGQTMTAAAATSGIAMGRAATVQGAYGIAQGDGVVSGATGQNVAIGSSGTTSNSTSSSGGAVAIGRAQKATGNGAVAIGDPNTATGTGAVALGADNVAAGSLDGTVAADGTVALGNNNRAIGQGSVAIGNRSITAASGGVALGDSANASATDALALGTGANAANAGDVALGAGSTSTSAVATTGVNLNGTDYGFAGAAPTSTVSIGSLGQERTLTNVAAGRLGAGSTDAVNGSQLDATNQALAATDATANMGWNVTTGATGSGTVNGSSISNVTPGGTVSYTAGDNIALTQSGNDITIATSATPSFTSVKTGNSQLDNAGLTITGGPSVTSGGIDAAGMRIANVAAGSAGTDAVNMDQLNTVAATANQGWKLGANGEATPQTVAPGDTVNFENGDNIEITRNGNDIQVATKKDASFDSVTTGASVLNNSGLAVGPDVMLANTGLTIAGGPTVTKSGIDAANTRIANVADGTVANDAVNLGQLNSATAAAGQGWKLSANGEATPQTVAPGDTVNFENGDNIEVTRNGNNIQMATAKDASFDSITTGASVLNNNGLTIVGGPSVTKTGIDAANTRIANVAAGVSGTDAVNMDQLNSVANAAGTAGQGWQLGANGEATTQTVAPGDTVDFVDGDNIEVTRDGQKIKIATAKDASFDSVTTGASVLDNNGLQVGSSVNLGNSGLVIVGGPRVTSAGIDAGGRAITNVAAGVNDTDAVNMSQLNQVAASATGGSSQWIAGSSANFVAPSATGNDSAAVGSGASAGANNSLALGTGASASIDNSVALGNGSTTTAAVGTSGTTIGGKHYDFAGSAPVGVVSVGSLGGERQVQNVAAGQINANSTDAVNGSQLWATNQAIADLHQSVAAGASHYQSVNDGGAQGGNYHNDGATGSYAMASGVAATAAGVGGVAMGHNASAGADHTVALGGDAKASAQGGVALGQGATADRAGMSGGREAVSNVAVDSTQGAVSVGSAGSERQITNVAGGTQATDAVNLRQLQAVQASSLQYDQHADGSVDQNNLTLGDQGNGPVAIHNVAPGVASTDAANMGQLNAGLAHANERIEEVSRTASAGIASAMSMEDAPYVPGKVSYASGIGYYDGESAVGLALRKTSNNGRWSVGGGVSANAVGVAARVGISGVF